MPSRSSIVPINRFAGVPYERYVLKTGIDAIHAHGKSHGVEISLNSRAQMLCTLNLDGDPRLELDIGCGGGPWRPVALLSLFCQCNPRWTGSLKHSAENIST